MFYYDKMMQMADRMGGTFDDAFLEFVLFGFVGVALIGWAFGFTVDLGFNLYEAMKELLRFILRRFRRKKKEGP